MPQTAPTASTLSSVSTAQSSLVTPSAMVTTQPATSNAATPAPSVSTALATVVNEILNPFAGNTPAAPPVDPPTTWVLLAAVRRELSGAAVNLDPPSPITVSPTLTFTNGIVYGSANATQGLASPGNTDPNSLFDIAGLVPGLVPLRDNGYNVDPSSTEDVTAFYGILATAPAAGGTVQGGQEFDVVDTITGKTVGTFDALENNANSGIWFPASIIPLMFGGTYEELLVTKDLGTGTVGTAAGDTPPVGSVIDTYNYGQFGIFYSAMPSPSGDVISDEFVTPFGDIPLHTTYDAAAGLADHSVDDTPVQLTNGYYIAPETPSTENFTAITGLPPFAVAVQGDQVFDVYQTGTNAPIGSFDGYVTTTSDTNGIHTEAILVTSDHGSTNVGTAAGDIPPVGSVYNVIYSGNREILYYSSLPSPSGDVISDKLLTPLGDLPLPTTFDAAAPLPIQSLSVPGYYSFVPASTGQLAGINGLPPGNVAIQGYQQFDVDNSAGTQIGSFDADVVTDSYIVGNYSEAVLVTNDTAGTAGTAAGDVPPVGSEFDFVYYGHSGFGTIYSDVPTPSGDVTSETFVTPLGDINIPTSNDPSAGLTADSFFDPFLP